jgi:hypothetical protein
MIDRTDTPKTGRAKHTVERQRNEVCEPFNVAAHRLSAQEKPRLAKAVSPYRSWVCRRIDLFTV